MPLITLKIAATDNASQTLDKVQKKLAALDKAAAAGSKAPVGGADIDIKDLDNLLSGVASGGLGGLLAGAGIGAGIVALGSMGMAMAETGAKAQALEASFGSMASAAGQSSAQMLSAMQQASGGTIANTDLMLAANRAMSFGVADTAEEMTSLIQLAMAQAAKMGIPVQQAFDDLVTGVGRLSPMILDNLGVTVSTEKAFAAYATELGKTADQLTETEKRQAFLNAMMAAAPNAAAESATAAASNASAFAKMDVSLKNFSDSLGMLLAGPMADIAEWVSWMAENATDATDFAQGKDNRTLDEVNAQLAEAKTRLEALNSVETPSYAPNIAAVNEVNDEIATLLERKAALTAPVQNPMTAELREQGALVNELTEKYWELKNIAMASGSVEDGNAAANVKANLDSALNAFKELAMTEKSAEAIVNEMGERSVDTFLQIAEAGQAAAAAVGAAFVSLESTTGSQIDSLTKGLIDSMGALAALDLNSALKAEMSDLIAAYQAAGISAEASGYLIVEWFNQEAEAARAAAEATGRYERSVGRAGATSARSIPAIRGMAVALREVAMAAAAGGGPSRMDKWERLNYDLTGITPKAYAMRDGMDALAGAFDSAAYSAGSFGGAAAASVDDGIAGKVQSLLSGSLDVGVGVDTSSFLPREDALNEDARRLADVMVNGFSSPWASYFESNFPALFAEMTAGGDIQAGAAALLQQFEQGLRPELINQEAVKERVKAMLVGDANMAALAADITADLQAELAGMDPAQVASMVNGALGIQDTGVGAGIEDELGNAALIGKIQGTGTTAGKSWGQAFLAYVENNVPATLVGLLVDLVTPGVRAKIAEESSAGGAL